MENITFAYFSEIIKELDSGITFEEFAVTTIPDNKNKIIIDLDNKNIIIGTRNVA